MPPRMAFQSPPQPQAKPSQVLHTWPVKQVLQFQPGPCQHLWPTAGRGLQELILALPLNTDEVKSPQWAQSPAEPTGPAPAPGWGAGEERGRERQRDRD